MRPGYLLCSTLICALLVAPASAGPWVPEPEQGYIKLSSRWHYGLGYGDANGHEQDYGGYHEWSVQVYAELGLVPGLAFVLNTPLLHTFWLKNPREGRYRGHVQPGNPQLGLRYRLLQRDRFALALETQFKPPMAQTGEVQPMYRAAGALGEQIGALQVGAPAWDFSAGFSLGYAWRYIYTAAGCGYIVRTHGYDDDVAFTIEGGFSYGNWSARNRVSGRLPLRVGDESVPRHDSPSGIGNGTSYVGIAAEVDYRVYRTWVVGLSFEGGLFAVRRQSRGPVSALYLATAF
jgi:hypothetical protein